MNPAFASKYWEHVLVNGEWYKKRAPSNKSVLELYVIHQSYIFVVAGIK